MRHLQSTCVTQAATIESMRFSRIIIALHHAASDLAKSSRLSIPQPPSSTVRCRAPPTTRT